MNRRNIRRREPILNYKVHDTESGEIIGWIVDFHTEGLRMSGSSLLDAGKHLDLTIELPAVILGKSSINFVAEILWSRPDINPSYYATGMRFIKIDQPDLESLVGLLVEHSYKIEKS